MGNGDGIELSRFDRRRREDSSKRLFQRHLLPGRKCRGKNDRFQRITHRGQRGIGQSAHWPRNRIVDLAMHLFGQPKECGGTLVLLLRRRQAGGDPKPFYLVNGNPARIGVMAQALRQPVLSLV